MAVTVRRTFTWSRGLLSAFLANLAFICWYISRVRRTVMGPQSFRNPRSFHHESYFSRFHCLEQLGCECSWSPESCCKQQLWYGLQVFSRNIMLKLSPGRAVAGTAKGSAFQSTARADCSANVVSSYSTVYITPPASYVLPLLSAISLLKSVELLQLPSPLKRSPWYLLHHWESKAQQQHL